MRFPVRRTTYGILICDNFLFEFSVLVRYLGIL